MILPGFAAVIILYNPDSGIVIENIKKLLKQIDEIILVDNSAEKLAADTLVEINSLSPLKVHYLFNNENLGVAKAQNIGIRYALKSGNDFVIIFDQDSVVSDNMVMNLKTDFDLLCERNIKIGAIGSEPINMQTLTAYKPRISNFKPFFTDLPNIIEVPQLISSGALIHRAVFEEVGLMDEALFIDGVDHEWCWRAGTKGYTCALSKNAPLYHMLGEGDRKILGVAVAIPSPFRVYYQYRNYIYLCLKSYVPLYWKLNNGFKYMVKLFYYPIFVSPRALYLKNMLRGIKAGFKNLNTI